MVVTPNEQHNPGNPDQEPEINKLFRFVIKHRGSDLQLTVGQPPLMGLQGLIQQMDMPPLNRKQIQSLLEPLLSASRLLAVEGTGRITFNYIVGKQEAWFRVDLFSYDGELDLVARPFTAGTPELEE